MSSDLQLGQEPAGHLDPPAEPTMRADASDRSSARYRRPYAVAGSLELRALSRGQGDGSQALAEIADGR
ncbi:MULTISPECIES: hypothetical protein [unclassified Pseudofrankia]|uniref:hypothetical protein n=1 Tax=unclassified Pseudofrankia TaxID=2994372 RepID=UPI0008D9574C|nr:MULTISPECIES: hypothetical protein [unclassified Pseudofrankia]MDT3443865.1 hypothetical protein [Pseudofrankia sp. BMG5.37]OHV60868.1 hypothetical protein BCD48_40210 [Pseudofrankia sp. BMG5.36]